jgi:hypothetical protein
MNAGKLSLTETAYFVFAGGITVFGLVSVFWIIPHFHLQGDLRYHHTIWDSFFRIILFAVALAVPIAGGIISYRRGLYKRV